MTLESQRSAAFNRVQPLCILVTKQPNREHVIKLHEELKSIESVLIQDLQEYVIFPLRLVFKQVKTIQQDVFIEVFECLQFIFDKSFINNWQMFQDLFTTFCLLISSPENTSPGVGISEELTLVVLKTLTVLIHHTEWSVLELLYAPASLPVLGHAVSILLKEAELEKLRNLQILAMKCLDSLSQSSRKVHKRERLLLGDVFASFLPGISMTLARIITGDIKQGHAVIVKALDTWCKITCLVMSDESTQIEDEKQVKNMSSIKVNERIEDLMVNRTNDWMKSTSSKLLILVKQIITVRNHGNWRVRMALAEWSDLLLKSCYRSMSDSVMILLDVLVGFIGDEYPIIRHKSLSLLEQFKCRLPDMDDMKVLQEILADNLHTLTTSLPRQIHMADEDEKLCIVNLLNGYLTLLGPDINSVLRSLAHLRRLSLSLVQALELDCSHIRIIEQKASTLGSGFSGLPSVSEVTQPNKTFKHFRDDKIQVALFKTCKLLGCHGELDLLVDHMIDIYHESSLYQLPAILIINEIISGSASTQNDTAKNGENNLSIIRMLLDEYLTDSKINLPIKTRDSSQTADLTFINMNENIMHICLLLEGIGKFAKVLGEEFDCMMIEVIYPLLEKLGEDNTYISHTAYISLLDICTACHYRSIDELICRNSDYLVNAISLKLRHFNDGYRAPSVLQVMIQYSSSEILPLIHDTIQEILESLDDHYETETAVYMNVLKVLLLSIIRWFPCDKAESRNVNLDTQPENSFRPPMTMENVKQTKLTLKEIESYFLEYHRNKEVVEGNLDEVKDEVEDADHDDTEDIYDKDSETNKKLPDHIIAVKEILTRSKHLLSSGNPRHRLLVLEVIQYSTMVLHSYQDELLPLLHEIWPPFVLRFSDEEKLVTVKAMESLQIMCDYSGDFLMKRTVKDVIPLITQFLVNQSTISYQSGSVYTFTVNYKLQLIFLQSLGPLAAKMKIQSYDLSILISCCLSYLNTQQPKSLHEACLKSFHYFIKLDSDVVWLLLNNLYSPLELRPPSACFKPVQFKKSPLDVNEYSDSINLLLHLTNETVL